MILSNGLHAVLGMSIIKEESAMQRQTAMMLVTPTVWIYFLVYSGKGSEDFNWKILVGMLLLFLGVIWYIKSDRDISEELSRNTYLQSNNMHFKASDKEETELLLEEDDTLQTY